MDLNNKEEIEDLTKNNSEFRFYTVGGSVLVVSSHHSYIGNGTPEGPWTPQCGVDVALQSFERRMESNERSGLGDRKIVTEPLSSARIVGIDVITNADYDQAHPAGSSLADIMEIDYIGEDGRYYSTMDLNDFFKTYSGLDIKIRQESKGFVFRLNAKTVPLEKNYLYVNTRPLDKSSFRRTMPEGEGNYYILAVDVTLRLTLEDGTTISVTDIIPTKKI